MRVSVSVRARTRLKVRVSDEGDGEGDNYLPCQELLHSQARLARILAQPHLLLGQRLEALVAQAALEKVVEEGRVDRHLDPPTPSTQVSIETSARAWAWAWAWAWACCLCGLTLPGPWGVRAGPWGHAWGLSGGVHGAMGRRDRHLHAPGVKQASPPLDLFGPQARQRRRW